MASGATPLQTARASPFETTRATPLETTRATPLQPSLPLFAPTALSGVNALNLLIPRVCSAGSNGLIVPIPQVHIPTICGQNLLSQDHSD